MEEKKNIGSLFDRIARRYDFLNHLLSFNADKYWRRRAIKTIVREHKQTAHCRCLDVAIGTADLAIELASEMPNSKIDGLDLSAQMMQIGENKVSKKGLTERITFIQGSALDMPFENDTYDILTCSYGVRNFSDLDKGLKEMHRVLGKGGKLMILEFSYPSNKFIAWVYDLYFSHILPFVGRIVSGDKNAYSYLNRSVKNFVWGEEMCTHINNAGFSQVQFKPMTFGITTIYTATK